MKITLVEATRGLWDTGISIRHTSADPLGIEYVGAVAKKHGYDVSILQQRKESNKEFLEKIIATEPDVVGFSTMTYNFNYSKEIATALKSKINPIIIFGGYHITALPEEIENSPIDFAVIGEGEYAFLDLLNNLDNPKKVKGIAFYDYNKKKLIITEPRERINNLDELPFPLRYKEFIKDNKTTQIGYPTPNKQVLVQISYSRGCYFNCSYCASKKQWGCGVKFRSAKNLVDEIKYLQANFGINYLFFTDLTFNSNPKKVQELCEEIIKRRKSKDIKDFYWYCMVKPLSTFDPKLYTLMKSAGCSRTAFGLEVLNDIVLKKLKRRHTLEETINTLKITDSIGLINRGFLIIGHPEETKESIKKTKEILKKEIAVDEIRISFLTPLPGTELYEKYKMKPSELITTDFSRFTTDEPILKIKNLTTEQLLEERSKILKDFYESDEYRKRVYEKIKKFGHLEDSYEYFFKLLRKNGINVNL